MSDTTITRNARSAAQSGETIMLPGFAVDLWSPALSCGAEWNAKLHEGFSALGCEWQEFVSRRLQDDLGFVRVVSSSQSPEQAWGAYVKFWQKATEDYAREFATMSKLTGQIITSGIDTMQHHLQATPDPRPASKAA
jgi:hypothetical protein